MFTNPVIKKKQTICVAAGKSGGHLIPALQIAQNRQKQDPETALVLVSYGTKLDETIYKQYPCISQIKSFSFTTFVARQLWRYPVIAYQTIKAIIDLVLFFRETQPTTIITTGGFIAIPACIAGKILQIPCEAYELNVHPGKAIQALSLLGAKIFVVFKRTLQQLPKATLTDYPIRFSQQDMQSQEAAQEFLNHAIKSEMPLTHQRKTIFIAGGSQGSLFLNELIFKLLEAAPHLKGKLQIIHQTGSNQEEYAQRYSKLEIPHLVFNFHAAIASCYQAADLVLCRAGAGTLFELLFFKRPSIIIPLATASTNHQIANALAVQEEYPELFSTFKQQDAEKEVAALVGLVEKKLRND